MGILDDIKESIKKISDRLPGIKDETVEKIKKVGEGGMDLTRDLISEISDKVNDITLLTRLNNEIKSKEKELNEALRILGVSAYGLSKSRAKKKELSPVLIEKISQMKAELTVKRSEYDKMQKERSDSYVVTKLSNELSAAGAIIDQTTLSENSSMAGKILKEITLPKEALITAIKRGEEVIIPDGNTQLLAGDLITVSGMEGDVKKVIDRLEAINKSGKKS